MNTPSFENLDLACAKVAKEITEKPSKELGNTITAALGVLEEQGLYALFLYHEVHRKDEGKAVSDKLKEFLKNTPKQNPILTGNGDSFTLLQSLANDLDKLLLARDLVRQTLVYARYHAKLKEEKEARS
jgi:hypothetical protein